mmetsp:Transcript_85585/g.242732  ORF Transcript_85585/g.242732 Transcript_85585/m.242732 type:complete len:254 (-) Transcript_85585:224-985(-)
MSFRGMTLDKAHPRVPYARAKSTLLSSWSTLFSTITNLWSRPARDLVSTSSASPVVPGRSGSKSRRMRSARFANQRTTSRKLYPLPPAMPSDFTGMSIMPGVSMTCSPYGIAVPSGSSRRLRRKWPQKGCPKRCSSLKPTFSGQLRRVGPSSVSLPVACLCSTVNPSSVGATPVSWLWMPSSRLMKVDLPAEWLPTTRTMGVAGKARRSCSNGRPGRRASIGRTMASCSQVTTRVSSAAGSSTDSPAARSRMV